MTISRVFFVAQNLKMIQKGNVKLYGKSSDLCTNHDSNFLNNDDLFYRLKIRLLIIRQLLQNYVSFRKIPIFLKYFVIQWDLTQDVMNITFYSLANCI